MLRRVLWGVIAGVAMLAILDAIAARAGLVSGVVPKLEGTAPWTISRAAGVTALVALTLDVAFGLFVSTGVADRFVPRARSVEAHRWLSSATLATLAVHAFVLLLDRFVVFDVLDVVVPFSASYRPIAVALGAIAAYGAIVLHASFFFVRRIGGFAWRKLHYVSFVVFPLAVAHGLLAGTDAPAMHALYVGAVTLVSGLAVFRLLAVRAPGAG